MVPPIRVLIILALFITPAISYGQDRPARTGELRKAIRAEGACAVVGMSAEQSQLTALQRARASAVEQAAGVAVTAGTLVTNFTVAADFIKTYARGFIVREQAEWLPLGQYQKNPSTPPIPEYRVRLVADVHVPARKVSPLGLAAKLNTSIFRDGEQAQISIRTNREAGIAVFNIMADDRVTLLFPNAHAPDHLISAGREFIFPGKDDKVELAMETLPGHQRDAEAFLIVAWDRSRDVRIRERFPEGKPLAFAAFFRELSEIADVIEEAILPYEVVGKR